jgi:alpha-1,2-mannosyltransferase
MEHGTVTPSRRSVFASRMSELSERDIFGWRVIRKLGPLRVLRVVAIAYLAAHMARIALVDAPYLMDPAQPGTDISTYYAAGQRLRDEHPLYALSPGDYDVPLDPPYTTVPLLSPPIIGVVWRPLATLLPADVAMGAWFVVTATVFLGTIVWLVLTGSARRVALLLVLAPSLALTALSGDINTLLGPLLVGAWAAGQRGAWRLTGAAVAVAAALKLTPVFFVVWLAVFGGRRALVGFGAGIAAMAAISLLGAGWANHVAYLEVIRYTSTGGITPWSVSGAIASVGVAAPWPTAGLLVVGIAGAVGVALLRARPRAAFAVASLAAVYIGPVVHLVTLSLLLPAAAPWRENRAPGAEADE